MYNILVVDDDNNIRNGIIQILQDNLTFEYSIQHASNGLEALQRIVESHPSLIISDIKMKEHDGIWMLEMLKQSNIPCNIIMLSGYDDYNLIRNSMKYGAADYLLKPVNIQNLMDLITEIREKNPLSTYDTTKLEKRMKEKQFAGIHKEAFFDLLCCNPLEKAELKNLLESATIAASSGQAQEACSLFDQFFDGCSENIISEEEIRGMLTSWVYDLMQKNNSYIKIISQYKLTPYDLTNTLKMLPTLSQIKSRFCENLCTHVTDYCREKAENDEYMIQRAKDYIARNYSENITLQDVASQLYLHPNYFSTLFSSKANISFRDYLRLVRIENAKRLMQQPEMRIADIALKVGYNDISHFNRAFKRITSMTPSDYRKQQTLPRSASQFDVKKMK